MGPLNSKWYLRVAPDETYAEPCSWKANFALQLARINMASIEWQKKLEPVKAEMETTLAGLAGAPYKARDVKFKLPDFIDVTINAGDQRNPHGATIGQSLPNWGKVAEKGGRTVVMTNLYTDADSRETLGKQVSSLYCKATFDSFTTDPNDALLSVVLHEAAHNLGPAHDYAVKGKKDDDLFGGPLAATMEELKAQTSALFFTWWLVDKKLLTEDEAKHATLRDVAWAFGHISRGMYDGAGHPKPYSQLASIQLGSMLKAGALSWKAEEKAANGDRRGLLRGRPGQVAALGQRAGQAGADGQGQGRQEGRRGDEGQLRRREGRVGDAAHHHRRALAARAQGDVRLLGQALSECLATSSSATSFCTRRPRVQRRSLRASPSGSIRRRCSTQRRCRSRRLRGRSCRSTSAGTVRSRRPTRPSCPAAVRLPEVVAGFADIFSYARVSARVTVPERVYEQADVSVQVALSSLLGVYMSTSGCPVLSKLRPMVRFHLPFATELETFTRATSMYLLGQYLVAQDGGTPDWALTGLAETYRATSEVNRAFAPRLRAAAPKDANVNALIRLDSVTRSLPEVIAAEMDELRFLFGK